MWSCSIRDRKAMPDEDTTTSRGKGPSAGLREKTGALNVPNRNQDRSRFEKEPTYLSSKKEVKEIIPSG